MSPSLTQLPKAIESRQFERWFASRPLDDRKRRAARTPNVAPNVLVTGTSTNLEGSSQDGFVMLALHTPAEATYLMQILASGFLAILFLQSGIDKIVDRRGNLEWLKGHFAKSPFAGIVPAMLTTITILEVAAGALSAVGCVFVILSRDSTVAFYGAVVSAVAIIALFFGQRMAKDYPGAAVLVPYFLLALVAIYLLAQP